MNPLLKVLAAFVGVLVLSLIVLRQSGIVMGVRLAQNTFTGQIANIGLFSWVLVVLVLIELFIVYLLFFSFRNSV